MHNTPSPSPRRDTVIAATFYLISKYLQRPCPALGHAVADHLAILARDAQARGDEAFRDAVTRLEATWKELAAGALFQASNPQGRCVPAYLQ